MIESIVQQLSKITKEEAKILNGGSVEKEYYSHSQRFVIDRDRLLTSGQIISIRPHTRFVDFPAHSHNYVELIYMVSGSTTHIINNSLPLRLGTGELLFLNQHVTHAIRKADATDIALNFIVLPSFFDIALDMTGSDNVLGNFVAGCLQKGESDVSYLHFAVSDVLPVQNLVENIIWSIFHAHSNYQRITQISMGLLFLQLLNYTNRLEMPRAGRGNNAMVVDALREIEENYPNANFSCLARKHNVSLPYMSRLVKEATGQSFKTLLQQKRLAKAEQMLRQTNLSIAEIITAIGYENTSYFHRIFKDANGMTPRDYRRFHRSPSTG